MESLKTLARGALNDLEGVFARMPDDALDGLIEEIVKAKRIVVFGLGREGLQMRGFAMRLFHMGRDVAVWGDMTAPAAGPGDLLIVSAGPGDLPTAATLVGIASSAGARTALVTAQPGGGLAKAVDVVTVIPAQTMADDRGGAALGAADGLAVRDGADDRLRARDPQTSPALQRDRRNHAGAAYQSRVRPGGGRCKMATAGIRGARRGNRRRPGDSNPARGQATSTSRRRRGGFARW